MQPDPQGATSSISSGFLIVDDADQHGKATVNLLRHFERDG